MHYQLTPAYDVCPMLRSGLTANQAMVVGTEGRLSTVRNALTEAGLFGFSRETAEIVREELVDTINIRWAEAAERANLTKVQSALLRRSTVLADGI